MNSKDLILSMMREQGKSDALNLRNRATDMDGTALIAEEKKIPLFIPGKDYSGWPVGAPVAEIVDGETQIFKWLIPVNTANYPGMLPSNSPTQLSPCHTKDPNKAKAWLAPNGISGLYMRDEVCTDPNAEDPMAVYRSLKNNNEFAPSAYPDYWELVT